MPNILRFVARSSQSKEPLYGTDPLSACQVRRLGQLGAPRSEFNGLQRFEAWQLLASWPVPAELGSVVPYQRTSPHHGPGQVLCHKAQT